MAEHLRPVVNPIESIDVLDLIAEPGSDEPDWLIEGLLERQGRVLLAGDEGSGKSLLSLTMAVQAVAGLPVLGEWKVATGLRIAYFELEMSRRTLRRRSKILGLAANQKTEFPSGELFLAHHPNGLNIGPRSHDGARILRFVEKEEPDLVIFDPLYRMASTDQVGEAETRPLIDFIAKVRELGAATWIVHHTRKRQGGGDRVKDSSDVYGSSILLRWPEAVFALFNDGGRRGRLKVLKDREGFFEDQDEWLVKRGGAWPIGIVQEAPLDTARGEIVKHLRLLGPRSAGSIAKEAGLRREVALKAIRALADEKIIERVRSGQRTSWSLTEDGDGFEKVREAFFDPPEEGE